jgi:hypothetical protein
MQGDLRSFNRILLFERHRIRRRRNSARALSAAKVILSPLDQDTR